MPARSASSCCSISSKSMSTEAALAPASSPPPLDFSHSPASMLPIFMCTARSRYREGFTPVSAPPGLDRFHAGLHHRIEHLRQTLVLILRFTFSVILPAPPDALPASPSGPATRSSPLPTQNSPQNRQLPPCRGNAESRGFILELQQLILGLARVNLGLLFVFLPHCLCRCLNHHLHRALELRLRRHRIGKAPPPPPPATSAYTLPASL